MSSQVNQKEAVYNAVHEVISHEDYSVAQLSKDDKKTVIAMVAEALKSGSVIVSEAKQSKMKTDKDYRDYASNLTNNWLAKDLRLNGNEPHQPKNPGSRAGAGDEMIRELKKVLKLAEAQGNQEAIDEVSEAIKERQQELAAQKAAANIEEINFDLIPQFSHLANS